MADRQLPLEWVDDMKTPSGRIHVGSLRGVVIHDLIYKALLDHGVTSKFTYIFDDHDPMDGLPAYLDSKKWDKYMGMQLYKIPSPEKGFDNFAQCYAREFENVFNSINCHPEIIWASKLYASGRMNGVIKEILDNALAVREVYEKIYSKKIEQDWYPFAVVCENCQKIGTTRVYKWDGEKVHYRCEPDIVKWAVGCGHEGQVSPYDGAGKLNWKVEWAAKWKVIGVTVEGAGKDHMSAGGSHDVASEISRKVLHYPVPYPFSYEFFVIGGRKMSSSKGRGASAKEVADILPPNVFRFLIVRTPVERALDFAPYGDTILNLFDDYDRCMSAYFDRLEGKISKDKAGEVLLDFARIIELSQVRPLPKTRIFIPRFRTIVNLLSTATDIAAFFTAQKGAALAPEEKEILEERVVYAQVYKKQYATAEAGTKKVSLSKKQTQFLHNLADTLQENAYATGDEIQHEFFNLAKTSDLFPKDAFQALYVALLGKPYGPKAGQLLFDGLQKDSKSLIEKLQKIS